MKARRELESSSSKVKNVIITVVHFLYLTVSTIKKTLDQ